MSEELAAWIWLGLAGYASLGALLWLGLVLGLIKRLDALAASAPWRVKALIAPGVVALWPVVLSRSLDPRKRRP